MGFHGYGDAPRQVWGVDVWREPGMQSGLEWGCTRSRNDPVRITQGLQCPVSSPVSLRGQPGTQDGGEGIGADSHFSCLHPVRIAQLPCTPLPLGVGRGRVCEHECI